MRTDANLNLLCENLRATYGDFHKSCRQAGMSTDFVTNWIKDDKVAAEQIQEAQRIGYMGLESVALDRAVHGTEKGVYFKGERVGWEIEHHDSLLVKVMEANLPKYKKGEQGGNTFNGPTQINVMPRAETFEQWLEMKNATLADRAAKALPAPVKVPEILQGDYIDLTPERPLAHLKDLL